jgi:hypothetical protein
MARRSVFICDSKGCGAVLLEGHDGFLIRGTISEALVDNPKTLVGAEQVESTNGVPETALCEKCLLQVLGLSK